MDTEEALKRLAEIPPKSLSLWGRKGEENAKRYFPLCAKEGYLSHKIDNSDFRKEHYPHFVGIRERVCFNDKRLDFETYYLFEYHAYWDEELIKKINRIPKLPRRF